MTSYIFDILRTEEDREEYAPCSDCDVQEGDGAFFDWVEGLMDEKHAEDRKRALSQLANQLGDILDVDTESAVLTYKGGVDKYIQNAADRISAELRKDTPDLWNTRKIATNPLDTDFLFLEEMSYNADSSLCFADMLLELDKGDKLFVGGVYRYHY